MLLCFVIFLILLLIFTILLNYCRQLDVLFLHCRLYCSHSILRAVDVPLSSCWDLCLVFNTHCFFYMNWIKPLSSWNCLSLCYQKKNVIIHAHNVRPTDAIQRMKCKRIMVSDALWVSVSLFSTHQYCSAIVINVPHTCVNESVTICFAHPELFCNKF